MGQATAAYAWKPSWAPLQHLKQAAGEIEKARRLNCRDWTRPVLANLCANSWCFLLKDEPEQPGGLAQSCDITVLRSLHMLRRR
jgi:hypothetical protein